ncbi:isochorismatase [Corynebacterium hindlerae]|uniref:phosphopantetheine-binding protein n=1 Tax=Corynebacterium hindlerae TaxID=699041 RepID=UPI001AD71118|nr:phosphopantetheine-binding protein [Corynebacterium hindlerae]QTH59761.1 isochorismatase [Corynebacterium hindlerae]
MLLTKEKIMRDTAEALGMEPDALSTTVPVVDQGLNSLRLMMLVERWRCEGYPADFHQLMALDSVDKWLECLTAE